MLFGMLINTCIQESMKNSVIISLYKKGVCDITAHSLDSDVAYKVYKFKKFVRNAISSISEKENELVASTGLTLEEQKEIKTLLSIKDMTQDQKSRVSEISEKIARANELIAELHNDDVALPGGELITYSQWHELSKENDLDSEMEMLLEGILWN